jgi:predicted AAA+ superfamily ATPase
MVPRHISSKIELWARQYPVLTVTGPRQSGKSTLCRDVFRNKPYISLEDISIRQQAIEDPRGFLARFPDGAILDEIQRAPDLSSYIQTIVDSRDEQGMFILTGSRQFELMESVSQSLAGRTAIARLLPFSYREVYGEGKAPSLETMLYTGFYPRIHDKGLNPSEAMSFYLSTYVERDIRQMLNIKDLSRFETFIKVLAGRSGQLLNASAVGNECGLSHNTVSSWIGVLEQSSIIYLLRPYHGNLGKRLLKSPKLYFLDTGLLCYLLNIFEPGQLVGHPLRGQVFESYVIAELLKGRFNRGLPDVMLFYRDQKGNEVDMVAETAGGKIFLEIKSSATFHADYLRGLDYLARLLPGPARRILILGNADAPYDFKDVAVRGYPTLDTLL